MKSAVRLLRLKDGTRVISMAIMVSAEELDGANQVSFEERIESLPVIMDYARKGNIDFFLCFLRGLIHNVEFWNGRKDPRFKSIVEGAIERARSLKK